MLIKLRFFEESRTINALEHLVVAVSAPVCSRKAQQFELLDFSCRRNVNLFAISQKVGQGLPLWLPKGATIRRVIERYIVDKELAPPFGSQSGSPCPTFCEIANSFSSFPSFLWSRSFASSRRRRCSSSSAFLKKAVP